MQRFKKILVYADTGAETQRALKRGFKLVKNNNAELKVVDVIKPLPAYIDPLSDLPIRLRDHVAEETSKRLEAILAPFKDKGVRISGEILYGRPFLQIIREVLRNNHDLLIKSAGGEEASGVFFGSTDLHLLRKCPCALWLVKPGEARLFERILAAIDPVSRTGEESLDMNTKIMELAVSLSELEGSELHVAHAWKAHGEELLRHRVGTDDLRQYVEETRELVTQTVHEFLSAFKKDISRSNVHIQKGAPDSVISNLVKTKGIDLIVMGTLARSGIAGFLIGNAAEKILAQVECSVLTIKPDGFVSPVTLEEG